MMKAVELMREILEETKIVKSTLEAGDISVASDAIEKREALISQLLEIKSAKDDPEVIELWTQYQALDTKCRELLNALKIKTQNAFYDNRSQKRALHKNKQAYDQYHMRSIVPGHSRFDIKK